MKTFNRYNLISLNLLTWLMMTAAMALPLHSNAQSEDKNQLLQMIEDDRATVEAIAGYDEKIQNHILQVAQTPEVLDKLEELQKRSQNQFKLIIQDYDRDAQTAFYDLARYPNLITELVSSGKPSESEVDRIVSNYPVDIHETAKKNARMYFDVLLRIDQLNNEIDRAFKEYLEPYNPQTRESVSALLAYPEIVSTLVEDKDFTALLGTVYLEDPDWVVSQLEQISQDLAKQNKEDLNAYKAQIESDPEAYNEMLDASEKFAKETNNARNNDEDSDPVVEVRVINSYPYWFGYPYWYTDPVWRPYPVYYHTGFYRNHFGNVVFIGLPSFHFIHWQTYYHPSLFPHLSYNYYNYYENHYVRRYEQMNRPVPHHGFYRSIEANVVNNPRVNNSTLRGIDHQRGNNIVRQPNTNFSGSSRRGNTGINRQGEGSYSRPGSGTRGTFNNRSNGAINGRGSSLDNRTYVRPQTNGRSYDRPVEYNSSTTRQPNSSQFGRNRSAEQQRPAVQRSAAVGQTGRSSVREYSQPQRSQPSSVRQSARSIRREANATSPNKRASREKAASKTERSSGRQR